MRHGVLALGVKARNTPARHHERQRSGHLDVGHECFAAISCIHTVRQRGVVVEVEANCIATVQQRPMLFVQRNRFAKHSLFMVVELAWVTFHTHPAKQCGERAQLNTVRTPSGVRSTSANMHTQHLVGHPHAHPALDALALERVDAIASPHTVHALQHTVVDSPTTRCTRFKLHMWVGCTQLINESVERHRLAMRTSSTIGRRGVNEWSVHIPFHECNAMIAQQRIELTKHMCVCRIVGQIKH